MFLIYRKLIGKVERGGGAIEEEHKTPENLHLDFQPSSKKQKIKKMEKKEKKKNETQ